MLELIKLAPTRGHVENTSLDDAALRYFGALVPLAAAVDDAQDHLPPKLAAAFKSFQAKIYDPGWWCRMPHVEE